MRTVAIVGSSLAGLRAAETFRREGYDGRIVAIGGEPHLPYDRPPLSKELLAGTSEPDDVRLRKQGVDDLDDALALRAALEAGPKVVVIGAGFIGAEVAATCRGRGLDVTVLEALPQPMVRGVGPELGAVIGEMHRDHGVDMRTGVQVDAIEGGERVERVRLGDGSTIEADVVLVGVGVVPATAWLEGS